MRSCRQVMALAQTTAGMEKKEVGQLPIKHGCPRAPREERAGANLSASLTAQVIGGPRGTLPVPWQEGFALLHVCVCGGGELTRRRALG